MDENDENKVTTNFWQFIGLGCPPSIIDQIQRDLGKVITQNIKIQADIQGIKEQLIIMAQTQAEFNAKIDQANTALDEIATAIAEEAAQIRAYIEANPTLDTSLLDGVVTRLEGVNESVGGVFEETPVEPTP